jgi:Lrp/AsnC family leucine-responsive transcriptional regulator
VEKKLDLKDRKILFELDNDSRQSYSEIAKKVGLSKETCIYRINKLISEKVITNFSTLIGLGNLGLFSHKLYFQLHGLTEETKQQMIKELQKNKKINWIAECSGEFDLIVAILCKNIKEFDDEKSQILQKFSQYIQNYSVGIMSETHIYQRDYLIDKSSQKEMFLIGKLNSIKIDEKDKKILKLISSNSRIQILDISEKTKLNVKTIISRMKKLEKENIIQAYKIFLDLNKIDYKFYKAFISINKMDKEKFKEFLSFCNLNKNIIHLVENVGSWELEPEFEVENEDQFYEIINQMKNQFPDFIKKIQTIKIQKEHKAIYSPVDIL